MTQPDIEPNPQSIAKEVGALPGHMMAAFMSPPISSWREFARKSATFTIEGGIMFATAMGTAWCLDNLDSSLKEVILSNPYSGVAALLSPVPVGFATVFGLRRFIRGSMYRPLVRFNF